ncbi:hypothetical protein BZG02_12250 [Labilibaculum filiforme]|uniref:Uncharacterized protein n=1 Tax=Labilibaculum filiforme TaxID=1940526 RepID=A0A2N3HWS0_9BACT|nr:hypothetical protein BZG02_12250 [Labilibaculum filiforme]
MIVSKALLFIPLDWCIANRFFSFKILFYRVWQNVGGTAILAKKYGNYKDFRRRDRRDFKGVFGRKIVCCSSLDDGK